MVKKINNTNPISDLIDRLNTSLTPEYTFANIVVGDANKIANAAASQIGSDIKNSIYSPFILYGDSGLGKTHLLQAIGHLARQKSNGELKIIYTQLIDFVKNITNGIRHNKIEIIKKCYQSVDLLLVDDIHLIAEKDKSQEEFFHIFNFLFNKKKHIILTCDQVPKNIKKIEKRLISRFNQGLSLQLKPPELEMRAAILMNKSRQLNIAISEDVALFIAGQFKTNVRELEGALRRLKAGVEFLHIRAEDLNESEVRKILDDLLSNTKKLVDITDIQEVVCHYYGVNMVNLISKKRTQDLVIPRQMAMCLSKQYTRLSLAAIGMAFKRDHTTVIHAREKMLKQIKHNMTTKEDYQNLKLRIGSL